MSKDKKDDVLMTSQARESGVAATFYSIKPEPLNSMKEICLKFGRSEKTVRRWAAMGAPISRDGGKYWAEYWALSTWLLKQA